VLAFGFASSACYVVNDVVDREADRAHPRKRDRPIASGAVPVRTAGLYAAALLVLAAASVLLVAPANRLWLAVAVLAYVANAIAYNVRLKHLVVLDVVSLALGFVLRVLGGCAAVHVPPSSWLLNCVFFLAMFLAFGKRLGERRTMREAGGDAASARAVQEVYTDELLRMAAVVTAVACLVTYAGYVQAQHDRFTWGFNLLWLTILPATYGLLRSIVLLERGEFDDPTELAAGDRAFQAALVLFAVLTGALMLRFPGTPH
jgi:4-hydroxybenzoate polyprenyltransferase